MGQYACFFVDEPPEIEFRDGLFHVIYAAGEKTIERVMLPSVFARTIWRGEQALATFRKGAEVVEIRAAIGGH